METADGSGVSLTGHGVDLDVLTRIAAETGLKPDVDPAIVGPKSVAILAEGDSDLLASTLRQGPLALIENITESLIPKVELAEALPRNGLFFSISTRLAWSMDTAALFCDGMIARNLMTVGQRHDVELSLHEAVINAVLHGNLHLGMSLVDDPRAFDEFCRHLSNRLEEPMRASKRIDIQGWHEDGMLMIRVSDRGNGYDPESLVEHDITSKSGRGLSIMRTLAQSVEVSDGGRTVTMVYP